MVTVLPTGGWAGVLAVLDPRSSSLESLRFCSIRNRLALRKFFLNASVVNPDPVGLFPESGIICLESDPGKNEQTSKCYFIFALIMQKKYSGMLI